jgi:hypothetical protein
MQPLRSQSSLKPAVVASLILTFTLLLSGCANTGGAQRQPLSSEDARYLKTGTGKSKSAQEELSKKGSAVEFIGDILARFAVEGLIRLIIP